MYGSFIIGVTTHRIRPITISDESYPIWNYGRKLLTELNSIFGRIPITRGLNLCPYFPFIAVNMRERGIYS